MNKSVRSTSGFTIVELMIATTVFALVLILLTTGIMQFTRQYYKGLISSKTQNTSRAIIDDITRSVQYDIGQVNELRRVSPSAPLGAIVGYCIGEVKRYSFALDRQVVDGTPDVSANESNHGLIYDEVTGCNANSPALEVTGISGLSGSNPREMLGANMRLDALSITGSGDVYNITVRVIYGDEDLLDGSVGNRTCKMDRGREFCAISELSTTVNKRVN